MLALSEDAALDGLVTEVYRAATGVERWNAALDTLARGIGAAGAQLMGIDTASGSIRFIHDGGTVPWAGTLDYIREWHRYDPRLRLLCRLEPGQWLHCHEHFDESFVASDRFYQEFLLAYGARYTSVVRFVISPGMTIVICALRAVGYEPFNATEQRVLTRAANCIAEAIKLRSDIGLGEHAPQVGFAILRKLPYPVLVVGTNEATVFQNDAARALEASGKIRRINDVVHLSDAEEDQRLRTALGTLRQQCVALTGGLPHDAERNAVVRCAKSFSSAAVMHLALVEPEDSMGAFGDAAVIVVTVFVAGAADRLDPFVVGLAYRMTPSEARVAVALANGMTLKSIAQRHGVAISTIRTQLRGACEKVGVNRQTELVRVLATNPVLWSE